MSDQRKPVLITIPISHYCEKARWALERGGVEYHEERHLQGFHQWHVLSRGRALTTPVLTIPGRSPIGQSSEILEWVDAQVEPDMRLYPDDLASRARAIEHWLDVTLGPDGRGWMYGFLLDRPEVIENYGIPGIPDFERRFYRYAIKILKPYLAVRMRIEKTRPEAQSVMDVFDDVAARLEDGRPYLLGDRFTAADLTFAALSAAVVLPRRYGVELPPLDVLPKDLAKAVEEFRAHPAGQFALRICEEERPTPQWMLDESSSNVVETPRA